MKLAVLLFITYIFSGCDSGRTTIYSTQNCIENYHPTNLSSITSSVQKYDSSYVEVTGFYYSGFEASVLSNSKNSFYASSMLWVRFKSSIIDSLEKYRTQNESIWSNLTGKKIKIRGRINSNGHGHLGQYAATIENICYLEIYKW